MTQPLSDNPPTILLVDDEQSVRAIVLRILRRANFNVLEAATGQDALRISDSHAGTIDLLVTDMFMPGMRGPEVADQLIAKRPGIRVVFMSGYSDHDPKAGIPCGAGFLSKPFSGQELAAAVETALKSKPVSAG